MTPAKPKNRLWFWLALALALALAAAAAALLLRGSRVDAVTVRQAPLVRTLQFSARVATLSRVDVGSTVTGRVAQVRAMEGGVVKKGDVLVQLESQELLAAVAQAQASEQQALARVAGLRSTGRAGARAGVAQADATVRAAELELARTQQLVAQGFVSASRIDDLRRAAEVARAQLASAQAQARANEDAGTDVVQAQAQVALARAATAAAQARLAQAAVLAPADARVLVRQVEPGQIVQPGKALMSLALAGPTQLSALVDERFLDQLRTGQKAAVVADAYAGQRFTARVLSIAPAVDAQRGSVEVKFALDQQAPAFLREDMTLSVEVETGRRDSALVMPLAALQAQAGEGAATALVAVDGRAQPRNLRLGLRTLDAVEVLEGLAAGDAVLLGGKVQPDAKVRPQTVGWQPGQPMATVGATGKGGEAGSAMSNAMGR